HLLALLEPLRDDGDRLTVAAHGDRLLRNGRVRPDDVEEHAVRSALQRRGRYGERVLVRPHQQAQVDELTRPEFELRIREGGLEPDGPGSRIDLVVDQLDDAA